MKTSPGSGSGDGERPSQLDRFGLAALVGLGLILAGTAWTALGPEPPRLDRAVTAWAVEERADLPAVTAAFRAVTRLGNPDVATPLVLLLVAGWAVLHWLKVVPMLRGDTLFFVAVVLTARFGNPTLKDWVDRERPPPEVRLVEETSPSFPSGHAQFAGVAFGLSTLAIRHALRTAPAWARAVPIAASLALGLAVAASRVWLGVHYLTDVIGGFAMGLGIVIAARLARGAIRRRLTAAEVAASPDLG